MIAGLVILTIRWVYYLWRGVEGMGMGDAKLLAMIAAWLGPALTLVTLFFGALSASVVGLLWIAIARRKESPMTARIPFGSFLCGAALYAIYQGPANVGWYMQFFR
jgi:leader peptidase (prepilin peptidase)/N-methyltransferase